MTPRPPSDPDSPRRVAKSMLREALASLAALNLPAAAESVGVDRELLRAYAAESRPNLPTADALSDVAQYLDESAATLRAHAATLRRQAKAVARESGQ